MFALATALQPRCDACLDAARSARCCAGHRRDWHALLPLLATDDAPEYQEATADNTILVRTAAGAALWRAAQVQLWYDHSAVQCT